MLGLIMMLAFSPIQVYLMPGHPINTRTVDIQLAYYKTNANPKLPFTPMPSLQQPPSSTPHHPSCLSMHNSHRPCHWRIGVPPHSSDALPVASMSCYLRGPSPRPGEWLPLPPLVWEGPLPPEPSHEGEPYCRKE